MIESVRKTFLVILIIAIIALVATTVIKANRALHNSDVLIARADKTLEWVEVYGR